MTSKKSSQKFALLGGASVATAIASQARNYFRTGQAAVEVAKVARELLKPKKGKQKSKRRESKSQQAPIPRGMFNVPLSFQKVRFSQIPPINGVHGVRLHVSFMLPDISAPADTAACAPGNGWTNSGASDNYIGIAIDPTADTSSSYWTISSLGVTSRSLPMMQYATRLSSMLRNFERFRVKYLALETTPMVGTSEIGNVGFAYVSDPWKIVEANSVASTSQVFNYVRNIDNFHSMAAWAPRDTFVAFHEKTPTRWEDLLYTLNGRSTANVSYSDGDGSPREVMQGMLLAVHDSTLESYNRPLRHCTAHMVVDAYEMSLGEPISGLRMLTSGRSGHSLIRMSGSTTERKSEEPPREISTRRSSEQFVDLGLEEAQLPVSRQPLRQALPLSSSRPSESVTSPTRSYKS